MTQQPMPYGYPPQTQQYPPQQGYPQPPAPQQYAPPAPQQYAPQPPPYQQPYAPPVQQAGPPPAPLATGSLDDYFNQPSTTGGPAISWKGVPDGHTVYGIVARDVTAGDIQQEVGAPNTQEAGRPQFYRDGRPKFVMIVPLKVQPSQEYPEGDARLYVRGALRDELVRAMAEAKVEGAPTAGAAMAVTLTARKPGRGTIPRNEFRVQYTPAGQTQGQQLGQPAPTAGGPTGAPQVQQSTGGPSPAPVPQQPVQQYAQPAPQPVQQAPQYATQQVAQQGPPPAWAQAPVQQQPAPAQAPQQTGPQPAPGLSPEQEALIASMAGAGQVQQG